MTAQTLSTDAKKKIAELTTRYPTKQAALLPALWVAQREHGWISESLAQDVADELSLPVGHVHQVLSFYVLFHTNAVGKHVIWLCRSISCHLCGYEQLRTHLEKKLGIKEGQTTQDGMFTLLSNECLGACGGAPMFQLDDQYYENLTPERVDEILAKVGNTK